jgi:hypothetical protein
MHYFLFVVDKIFVGGKQCRSILEVDELQTVDLLDEIVVTDIGRVGTVRKEAPDVFGLDQVQLFVELIEQFLLDILVLGVRIHCIDLNIIATVASRAFS